MNFDITYQLILPALQKIAEITHSYGWAIILLTIAFRILVSPLVTQTTVSMRRMAKIQPQMKAIQERYKGNPEQLQKKLVEFYAKNKVNPLGGCLPTLVQLPILFALYAAFAGPPFTDKIIDIKINVVSPDKMQTVSREEVSGSNSIYVSKAGVPAKVVAFPGNSTIAIGSTLDFGVRAIEGKLASDFSPKWRIILPKDHETKEAQPAIQQTTYTKTTHTNKQTKTVTDKSAGITTGSTPEQAKTATEKLAIRATSDATEQAYIDTNGHAVFPAEGEYHIEAVIPGIAKDESFAFITGLGKVATGVSLLQPANFDIVFLVILFGVTMFLSQKLTVPTPKPADGQELDEQQVIQQQTMKTMPIVTTGMFFFFPIPAGVYLYLVVSNVIQTFQTWLITRMPEPEFVQEDNETITVNSSNNAKNGKKDGDKRSKAGIKPNKKAIVEKNEQARREGSGTENGIIDKAEKKPKRKKR